MKINHKFWNTISDKSINCKSNKWRQKLTVFGGIAFSVSFGNGASGSSFVKSQWKDVSDTLAERKVLNDVSVVV